MSINLEIRLKQLESLDNYISSSKDKIQSILDSLKWNKRDISKNDQLTTCSLDHNHRVPVKSLEDHVAKCLLRKEGYDLNEPFLSEPSKPSKSSIYIDDNKKLEILSEARKSIPGFKAAWNGMYSDPKTADRVLCTYSSDERLALYTYAIKNTEGPQSVPEFNTNQMVPSNNKPLTYQEMLIQERDAKRRRLKYKSVHTDRKNHTEVIREVINGQMEMFKDWLRDNEEDSTKLGYESCDKSKSNRSSVEKYSEHSQSGVSRVSVNSNSSKYESERRDKEHYKDSHSSKYTSERRDKKRYRDDKNRYSDRSDHKRYKDDHRNRYRKSHHSKSRDYKNSEER